MGKSKEWIIKAKNIHGNKYEYSLVDYKNSSTKVKIICPEHGIFEQTPNDHLSGYGCRECGNIQSHTKQALGNDRFIEKARVVHGSKYDYSLVDYKNSSTKVKIICPEHGIFEQAPTKHLSRSGCSKCGRRKQYKTQSMGIDKFIEQSKQVHNDRYDYSLVVYVNQDSKVKIICPEHGVFEQVPYSHLKGFVGCSVCKGRKITKAKSDTRKSFIEKAVKVHNDRYNYSNVEYHRSRQKVEILCEKHGAFKQTPNSHIGGNGCPKCVSIVSSYETYLSEWLTSLHIPYVSNNRKIIKPYELDFAFPDYNFAIEFNGLYWHSENAGGKDKKYHLTKYTKCKEAGITLFQIFEDEWVNSPDIIKSKMLNKLNRCNSKIYARKCNVDFISKEAARNFLNENHIQGNGKSSYAVGLHYNDELVAVMTFSKSRYNNNVDYEINRFAVKKYTSVVGGAGRLFKFFISQTNPQSVISYADLRYGEGGVYEKLGFTLTHRSSPNYWYTKHYKNRESRIKYQKHKISEGYDKSLTEWEIMQRKGYDRIWDCGNNVWLWKNPIDN